MATFNFELVSPDKVLVSEPAWQVVIPGEEGYLGVRAGHTSIIAAVKPGVVEVKKSESATAEKIFIAGGFADITAKNCTILAEQAVNVNELNAVTIENEIAHLAEQAKIATSATDKALAEKKLQIATLKLQAVKAA